ncbi:MAG: ubiquinol-cytochrome c reductase iron-sulfur subunit [Phycisphaerae bacterium]|nr:Rieske 2Fe-2S domain-containing protein [Tepidisphaeraceae bacterium]
MPDAQHAHADDPHAHVDPHLNGPGREGLTGTVPGSHYVTLPVRDQITIPPDGRPHDAQPQWRQDFPIDWPQDQYVARRDFTKFLVLTSLAFVVGQVSIGVQNLFRRRRGDLPIRKIANLADVPVGSSIVFDYPGEHEPCLLIRPSEHVLLSYSQSCTHLACAVVPRIPDNCIHCPCHNGYFDLHTGRPTAGPPRRPLPKILLDVRQGVVYATGIERSPT